MEAILTLLPQWGGVGAVVGALIWALTKYWDHKPAWSKALLEQQESLTRRIDKMQERIDALESEKSEREAAFTRLRARLYGMVSRIALLEGLLRANGVPVPEYPVDDLLEDAEFDWPRRYTTSQDMPVPTTETE